MPDRPSSSASDAVLAAESHPVPAYSLPDLVGYFARLGTIGFGGPVALVGYMHRDLVERRGWISEAEYKEGLTLAQIAPGPLAAQLAIYLGFVHYRVLGATLVGLAFVLPSFIMVVLLGWAYLRFQGLSWMQAVFYGVGASVIGIIALSAYKLTRKTVGRDRLLWLLYVVAAAFTVVTETERVWLFLAAGALVWLVRMTPKAFADRESRPLLSVSPLLLAGAAASGSGDWGTLGKIAAFFTKAGAFVFGSGLAIVPFLYGGVVNEYHWLDDRQFMDAVAVAMITPGPVVITVGFIGSLVAGLPGACVAAIATFLPCYLLTIIPAPYVKRHGKRPGIAAFVDGVTVAAIGTIAGAVIVLGRRSVFDLPTALLAATTLALLWRFRIPEPLIVIAAGAAGLLAYPMMRG
jgi:chromate transporter